MHTDSLAADTTPCNSLTRCFRAAFSETSLSTRSRSRSNACSVCLVRRKTTPIPRKISSCVKQGSVALSFSTSSHFFAKLIRGARLATISSVDGRSSANKRDGETLPACIAAGASATGSLTNTDIPMPNTRCTETIRGYRCMIASIGSCGGASGVCEVTEALGGAPSFFALGRLLPVLQHGSRNSHVNAVPTQPAKHALQSQSSIATHDAFPTTPTCLSRESVHAPPTCFTPRSPPRGLQTRRRQRRRHWREKSIRGDHTSAGRHRRRDRDPRSPCTATARMTHAQHE